MYRILLRVSVWVANLSMDFFQTAAIASRAGELGGWALKILVNLPREHVVRLVKVDVQELFERRKVSERRGLYRTWDKVRAWQPTRLETQGASRVQISERGYSFDEIVWELAPYLWVHLVFLGSYDFKRRDPPFGSRCAPLFS